MVLYRALMLGLLICLILVAILAVTIYVGAGREPSRPDD